MGLCRLWDLSTIRQKLEDGLHRALAQQRLLVALRPSMPKHAPLRDTELADKLIHHQLDYKLVLDTIRIACANAESELAVTLAPHLPRAAEAKKVLANLFAAPGQVRVAATTITITLRPAGTSRELEALSRVLNQLDVHNLALPGDPNSRLRSWISQDS